MVTTAAQAPPATSGRFTPAVWMVLAGESLVAAGILHLVVDIQSLTENLLFAVLFLIVGPLQVKFGARVIRGVTSVTATVTLVTSLALVSLLVYAHSAAVSNAPAGSNGTDVTGTVLLACGLVSVTALGAVMPAGIRRWTVNSLLGLGLAFWVIWLVISLV
ncbi:MAG TPA: hypothetical protein VFX16_33415 [Pseudonocardiaceae bacterium]|nr:hypothetical protein [Pseudonocardiaceae bacterium]